MKNRKLQTLMILIILYASTVCADHNHFRKSNTVEAAFVQTVTGGGQVVHAIQTRDGNYLSLNSAGEPGSYLVRKVTPLGKRIWERSLVISVAEDGYSILNSVAETNDGYVTVGYTSSYYYGFTGGIIIPIRSDGTLESTRIFQVNGNISFHSVGSTSDGGFTVIGGLYPGIFHPIVIRFTPQGSILWAKQFEDLSVTFASRSISNNAFVLASDVFTNNGPPTGVTLVKIDNSGQINWSKILPVPTSALTLGSSLDNGTVIAIHRDNSRTLLLVRFDENGRIEWKASYLLGLTGYSISSLSHTPDGGYLITGTTMKGNGFFLKIDSRRNVVLKKVVGLDGVSEEAQTIFVTQNGAYVLFGSTYRSKEDKNDMLFLNLNGDGVVPGCNFVRNLNVQRVNPPALPIETTTITSQNVALPTSTTLAITTRVSRKPSSVICP